MSREEEARLVALLPCPRARSTIVKAYMPHIKRQAHRIAYANRVEDAQQDGAIGLVRAIDRFDASLGLRLSTYAWIAIDRAIRRGNICEAKEATGHAYLDIIRGEVAPLVPLSIDAQRGDDGETWSDSLEAEGWEADFYEVDARIDSHRVRMAIRDVVHAERRAKRSPRAWRIVGAAAADLYWGESQKQDAAETAGVTRKTIRTVQIGLIDKVRARLQVVA
jgi:RNA polymerase sigma factor (sigma-70 family)